MSIDVLQEQICKLKNPTILGLDPSRQVVPPHLLIGAAGPEEIASAYETFCLELMEALACKVAGVKVQSACFFALGAPGISAMERVMSYAREKELYVILDAMWASTGPGAEALAQAAFAEPENSGVFRADGVTISAYAGGDCVKPYLPYCKEGKALFAAVKTPNRSSMEIQDLLTGGRLIYTAMADLVSRWGIGLNGKQGYSQVAALVSAGHPEILRSLRSKYQQVFFLVSGYGAQGGTAKSVSGAFDRLGRGAAVSASRSISGAWLKAETDGKDYVEKAVAAAEKMKRDIGKYVSIM